MIFNPIIGGKKLPVLDNPGSANDLLEGKQLIDQDGNSLTGTIPIKTSSDVSVNGANIVIPSGYYSNQVNTSVESVEQATPSISVSSSGLITSSVTQSAGYVTSGTKTSTKQLSTQSGTTITPGTAQKVAVASGKYTTGAVNVAGSSNLVASNIKSGVNIFGVVGNLSSPKIWSGTNLTSSFGYGSFTITFYDIPFISKVYAGCFDVYLVVNGQVYQITPTPLVISPNYVDGCYARFKGANYLGKYNMSTNGNVITFSSIYAEANNYSGSAVQTGGASVNYLVYE